MPNHSNELHIMRTFYGGLGLVRYSFTPYLLRDLLESVELQAVEDMPEDMLRLMCSQASDSNLGQLIEDGEAQFPGTVSLHLPGASGELRSEDLGIDLLKRFMPAAAQDGIAWDPQYSPVHFEIYMTEPAPDELDPARSIGRRVLYRLLQPPDLT